MGQKDLIFTSHAEERLRQRGISKGDAWATWRNPDETRPAQTKGNWIYYKRFGNQKIEVVTSKNKAGETIVISVWSRPVYTKKTESFWKFLVKKIFG